MEKSPKTLLKNISGKLSDGDSLTSTNGRGYNDGSDANKGKDAIKGLIGKQPATDTGPPLSSAGYTNSTSNNISMDKDKVIHDNTHIKYIHSSNGFINTQHLSPTTTSSKQKETIFNPDIMKIKIPVGEEKTKNIIAPIIQLPTAVKSPIIAPQIYSKKTNSKQNYSAFEMYLVVLNIFLSLGILCSIGGVVVAAYTIKNPDTPFSFGEIYQEAFNQLSDLKPVVIQHYNDSLVVITRYYENTTIESTTSLFEKLFGNTKNFVIEFYNSIEVFFTSFYVDIVLPRCAVMVEQIYTMVEDTKDFVKLLQ